MLSGCSANCGSHIGGANWWDPSISEYLRQTGLPVPSAGAPGPHPAWDHQPFLTKVGYVQWEPGLGAANQTAKGYPSGTLFVATFLNSSKATFGVVGGSAVLPTRSQLRNDAMYFFSRISNASEPLRIGAVNAAIANFVEGNLSTLPFSAAIPGPFRLEALGHEVGNVETRGAVVWNQAEWMWGYAYRQLEWNMTKNDHVVGALRISPDGFVDGEWRGGSAHSFASDEEFQALATQTFLSHGAPPPVFNAYHSHYATRCA